MSETFSIEAVRERMAALADPYRAQLVEVNRQIAVKNLELKELRELQTELARALRAIDPSYDPPAKKATANGGRKTYPISAGMLSRILDWLHDHADELANGFSAADLYKRHGLTFTSDSTVSQAVKALHDRGDLRLDRADGLSRYYKLAVEK